MYRVSATLLDSFRLYKTAEFISTEELDARIRRDPMEPSEAMRIGTAFHGIAEGRCVRDGDPGSPEGAVYTCDGYVFDAETADAALSWCRGGVPEVKKAGVVIPSEFGPIAIVGKADYLRGLMADEIKTKVGKEFNPADYIDAWQWRVYMRVFGVRSVVYRLVRLDLRDGVYFSKRDDLVLYPYSALDAEVDAAVRAVARYAADRGILDYLTQSSEGIAA